MRAAIHFYLALGPICGARKGAATEATHDVTCPECLQILAVARDPGGTQDATRKAGGADRLGGSAERSRATPA